MVGPTRVQAEWCVPSVLFFTSSGVRVILCNKGELSVPLASWGSFTRSGVSKKSDAEGVTKSDAGPTWCAESRCGVA